MHGGVAHASMRKPEVPLAQRSVRGARRGARELGTVHGRGRRNIGGTVERASQRSFDGPEHEVVHELRVAEADLELRRMRVDVDAARVERQVNHIRRLARLKQHVAKSKTHGVPQQLVAHEPVVDERELHVRLAARECRRREPAGQRDALYRAREMARVLHELVAAYDCQAALVLLATDGGRQGEDDSAVARETKLHVETSECEVSQHAVDVRELRLVGTLKLAPRGRVEKQIADLDRRPARARRRPRRAKLAAAACDLPRMLFGRDARCHREPGHRSDAGQRLTAKPERHQGFEVVERGDLARRVTRQCEAQLVARDTAAVVRDANERRAAGLDVDRD